MNNKPFKNAQIAENKQNYKKAFSIYLRATKKGDTYCELNLGFCYDNGIGVRKNKKKAAYYYKRCADRGDFCGANNLAILYKEKENFNMAEKYFGLAINLGDKDAALEMTKILIKKGCIDSAKDYLKIITDASPEEVTQATRDEALKTLNDMDQEHQKALVHPPAII
jgi:TPR repeat protein